MIEVTVKRFYTSEEADFVKSSTFDVLTTGPERDWAKLMEHMVERNGPDPDADFPLNNVREMTPEEVATYREANPDNGET